MVAPYIGNGAVRCLASSCRHAYLLVKDVLHNYVSMRKLVEHRIAIQVGGESLLCQRSSDRISINSKNGMCSFLKSANFYTITPPKLVEDGTTILVGVCSYLI